MLSESARRKAHTLFEIVQDAKDDNVRPKLSNYDLEWLTVTLLEADNRANEVDKMLATALQVIEDAGIMSEYLKFRNQ